MEEMRNEVITLKKKVKVKRDGPTIFRKGIRNIIVQS